MSDFALMFDTLFALKMEARGLLICVNHGAFKSNEQETTDGDSQDWWSRTTNEHMGLVIVELFIHGYTVYIYVYVYIYTHSFLYIIWISQLV